MAKIFCRNKGKREETLLRFNGELTELLGMLDVDVADMHGIGRGLLAAQLGLEVVDDKLQFRRDKPDVGDAQAVADPEKI